MKKIIAIMSAVMLCATLTGCGNMGLGLGNFTFEHLHFTDKLNAECATITKWYDNENGIEVKTEEFGSMYLSEGSYILIGDENDCPFCGE